MRLFYKTLLPVLLFSTTAAFAQRNFKSGYIVNMKGDTLQGAIDLQDWENNPSVIHFRDQGGKVTDQTPVSAKAFYLEQAGLYRSITVKISHDKININRPAFALDSAKTPATLFLKLLVTGKYVDLYQYKDAARNRFITLDKKTGQAAELTYHYYVSNAVKSAINGYRNELATFAQLHSVYNERFLARIQEADYEANDIIGLVDIINGKTSSTQAPTRVTTKAAKVKEAKPEVIAKSGNEKKLVTFFAGAALNSAKLSYYGFNDLAQDPKNTTTILPQLNVGVDFARDPDISRLIIRVEVSAFAGQFKSASANASKSTDVFSVALKPQLLYNVFIQDKFKAFVGAGFQYNLSSNSNMVYMVTTPKYNIINGQQELYNKWLSIPIKAGVLLDRHFEIYGSYIFPVEMESGGGLSYSTGLRFWQAGLNYHFR